MEKTNLQQRWREYFQKISKPQISNLVHMYFKHVTQPCIFRVLSKKMFKMIFACVSSQSMTRRHIKLNTTFTATCITSPTLYRRDNIIHERGGLDGIDVYTYIHTYTCSDLRHERIITSVLIAGGVYRARRLVKKKTRKVHVGLG